MSKVLKTHSEIKTQKLFIKKRNRVIQSVYRDGILGIEEPGDKNSHFYSIQIEEIQREKDKRD